MKNPWLTAVLAGAALALGLAVALWYQGGSNSAGLAAATRLPSPRALPAVVLQDQNAARFELTGRWHLLFFGFTHCPDICPSALALLKQVRRDLNDPRLRIVFVSLDPKRDTPARLGEYVGYFDPDFAGVTGSEEQLRALTAALYLPYALTAPDAEGNYSVDHSASLVLLNPAGQAVAYFAAPHEVGPIVSDLRRLLAS